MVRSRVVFPEPGVLQYEDVQDPSPVCRRHVRSRSATPASRELLVVHARKARLRRTVSHEHRRPPTDSVTAGRVMNQPQLALRAYTNTE